MKLDHISYVATHEQLADTVQRLGSRLGTTFVDGGIHPRFGTRNFTAALNNGQYFEIVCPLEHPATEKTPWGQAVTQKASEGGGWLTWVFSTENISKFEKKFGRTAIEGHRKRPNGSDLKWKQIGVKEISEFKEFPFFIEWLSPDHPSEDGKAHAQIETIQIASEKKLDDSWFKPEIVSSLDNVKINWISPSKNESQCGIISVTFSTPTGQVILD
jgi:hypothetical protein